MHKSNIRKTSDSKFKKTYKHPVSSFPLLKILNHFDFDLGRGRSGKTQRGVRLKTFKDKGFDLLR